MTDDRRPVRSRPRTSRNGYDRRQVLIALTLIALLSVTGLAVLPHHGSQAAPKAEEVSLTKAYALLAGKKVVSADDYISDIHPTRVIVLKTKDGHLQFFRSPPTATLESQLTASGADVKIHNDDVASVATQIMSLVSSLIIIFLFGGILLSGVRKFFTSPARLVRPGKNALTFNDVAGQLEAKDSLKEIIDMMRFPESYASSGANTPAGVLLIGPPGTGKTLLAKALAAECNKPFLYVSGSAFVEMYAGLAARRWRSLMKTARRQRNGCIIFVDEVERISGKRASTGGDVQNEQDQLLVEVLTSLDGMVSRKGIIFVGATNRPDLLDPAFTRPGRIDRTIHVTAPNEQDREALLQVHTRKLSLSPDLSLQYVARLIPGFTGAQIANLANEAALEAAHAHHSEIENLQNLKQRANDQDSADLARLKSQRPMVRQIDFDTARDVILMGRPRSLIGMDPAEIDICCNHEAGHALAAILNPDCDPVHKASILPRGGALGQVFQVPNRDQHMFSKRRLLADLIVLMAGRAAEAMIYQEDMISTGAQEDIAEATRQGRRLVGRFGMDKELGCMNYFGEDNGQGAASPQTLERVDTAVKNTIANAYDRARDLLELHKVAHRAIHDALLERHTLTGDEIKAIVANHPPTTLAA
jgi:cell division protease FtsH